MRVCPDVEWKLLVALWRFAGLRKMEVFQLTWGDVLWEDGRVRVTATKTAHHVGKDLRYVPIRDIREPLREVFEDQVADRDGGALPATDRIITRFTASNSNLDKPFKNLLLKAGLLPWPKLFQNLRASCETEWLTDGYPAHVVAGWIGHSVKVQRDSYAQVTDGHFETFNSREQTSQPDQKSWLPFGYAPDGIGANRQESSEPKLSHKREKPHKTLGFVGFQVAVEGLEPPTRGL